MARVRAGPRRHDRLRPGVGVVRDCPGDADVVVVDSITAWRLAVAVLRRRGRAAARGARPSTTRRRRRRGAAATSAGRARPLRLSPLCGGDRRRVERSPMIWSTGGCDPTASSSSSQAAICRPAGRAWISGGAGGSRSVCVANWYVNKGVLELLDAVAALPDDLVTLHLAGQGRRRRALRRPGSATACRRPTSAAESSSTGRSTARPCRTCTPAPTCSH